MTRSMLLLILTSALLLIPGGPAAAESSACIPFLCYADLATGAFICPNTDVYTVRVDPVITTPTNPTCDVSCWHAMVIQVDVPVECTKVAVWVEYSGEPEGFTTHIGDSPTNNGFAGDASSLPLGQNAEIEIFDDRLNLWSNATAPPVDRLVSQKLALEDGAIRIVVEDQAVSWGQPRTRASTLELEKLFFLPTEFTPPENRTLYVGLNRVVSPIGTQNTFRNGCGARRALITLE